MLTKTISFFTLILSLTLFQESHAGAIIYGEQAQQVLSEWFDVDPQFDIQMQQKSIAGDALGAKFSLEFISDDEQKVFGTLALPKDYDLAAKQPFKLALMLHAMGTDQNLWFDKERAIKAGLIGEHLRKNGYAILALDARHHGMRKINDMGPKEIIAKAHSAHRRMYNDMIVGSVRDYRLVLNWMESTYPIITTETAAFGYSMGAQMSLLLAAYESNVSYVVSMVPPYVSALESPVAPRQHVAQIEKAQVLLLAAKQDPYTTETEYQYVYDLIKSPNKEVQYFDSGHRLPDGFQEVVLAFIDEHMMGEYK